MMVPNQERNGTEPVAAFRACACLFACYMLPVETPEAVGMNSDGLVSMTTWILLLILLLLLLQTLLLTMLMPTSERFSLPRRASRRR
jgi:hypothetical protein